MAGFADFSYYLYPDATYQQIGSETSNAASSANITRSVFGIPIVTPLEVTPALETEYEGLVIENGPPLQSPVDVTLWIKVAYTGGGTRAQAERELLDDVNTIQAYLANPYGGETRLRVDRQNVATATVSRYVRAWVRNADTLMIAPAQSSLSMTHIPGDEQDGQDHCYYRVSLLCPEGVWQQRTASSDTSIQAATGGDSAALTNDGIRAAACKVTITAAASSPTEITLNMDGTNVAVISTTDSTFAANDYVSFGFDTPGQTETLDATVQVDVAAEAWLEVPRGGKTLIATTDAGTADLTVEWYPVFGSW